MARKRSLENILDILRQQIPILAERYNVETLEVFGSYVRSEQKKDSDLDILVTFKEDPSLLTYIAIENYLSDLLGIKVDLVMKDSLKPKIGQQILGKPSWYKELRDALHKISEFCFSRRTTQVRYATVTDETSGKTIALFRCTQLILYPRLGTDISSALAQSAPA